MSHSHSHSHSHEVGHSHSHSAVDDGSSTAEANRTHFDSKAQSYTNEASRYLTKKCADAILEAVGVSVEGIKALDFACGPGLISQHLAKEGASVVGVDISGNMVTEYNRQVSSFRSPVDVC